MVNNKKMSSYRLGEFEEIVLLTVAILHGQAYGISIIEEIEDRLDRQVHLGAVQTVLKRLEDKNMVSSAFGEATKIRGGKRKRYYKITTFGEQALKETKDQRLSLWDAIPRIAFK